MKRHVLVGFSFFLLLVSILTSMVHPVSGTLYPTNPGSYHTIVNAGFSNKMTTSDNQVNYAVVWDTTSQSVCLGFIPKGQISSHSSPTISGKKEFNGTVFGSTYVELDSPSVLLASNGTIGLVMRMRDSFTPTPDFLFFTKSSNNGTSWSTIYLLTGVNENTVRNNYLFQLNTTHIIALWEENLVPGNTDFSVVYRISPDFGTTWEDKVTVFVNCTQQFSAVKTLGGEIILNVIFDKAEYRPGMNVSLIYYEYYLPITVNLTAINASEPVLLYGLEGGELSVPFFMNKFSSGDLIFSYGQHVILSYKTAGKFSSKYQLVETTPIYLGMFMADGNTAVCLISNGNQCILIYLAYFTEVPGNLLTPEQTFIIVVVIIVGFQVCLYIIHKVRKRRDASGKVVGKSDMESSSAEKAPPEKEAAERAPLEKEAAERAPPEKEAAKRAPPEKKPDEKAAAEKGSTKNNTSAKPSAEKSSASKLTAGRVTNPAKPVSAKQDPPSTTRKKTKR